MPKFKKELAQELNNYLKKELGEKRYNQMLQKKNKEATKKISKQNNS